MKRINFNLRIQNSYNSDAIGDFDKDLEYIGIGAKNADIWSWESGFEMELILLCVNLEHLIKNKLKK